MVVMHEMRADTEGDWLQRDTNPEVASLPAHGMLRGMHALNVGTP